MKINSFKYATFPSLALLLLTANANAAVLANGTAIGVDFGNIVPTNNFNHASTTTGSIAAGSLKDTSNITVDGVGFSWIGTHINNQATPIGGEPAVFDATNGTGNLSAWLLSSNANITITFTGLTDSFTYGLFIGASSGAAANTNTTWTVDGQSDVTQDKTFGESFVSFSGLETNGSGTLVITGRNLTGQWSAVSALHLTAVPEASTSALIGIFGVALLARRKRR